MTMNTDIQDDGAKAIQQLVETVNKLVDTDRVPEAAKISLAALDRGQVHPLFLNLRSLWNQDRGRLREALADMQEAVKLAPENPLLHHGLGHVQSVLRDWPAAIESFRTSIALRPDLMPAHFQLGIALDGSGDLIGARKSFEHALALSPGDPEVLAQLAMLAARRADWSAVRALAEQALAANPREYLAHAALATAAIANDDLADAERLISVAFADRELLPQARATLLSLLGDLRDKQGRYAEAFKAYSEGNAASRRINAVLYGEPGRETVLTYGLYLINYFQDAPDAPWVVTGKPTPAVGPKVRNHVLLTGFARSGTTLLENVLASHPDAKALEEQEMLLDSAREYMWDDKGLDKLVQAGEATLDRFRADYWRRVEERVGPLDGKVFIDKRPLAAVRLPLYAKLFPGMKVLFALRDPRDVALSCFRREFKLNASMYQFLDLTSTAQHYVIFMTLAMIAHAKFKQPWLFTRHEALIKDFDAELARVCDFVGLPWDDAMRDFAEHAKSRPIATASSTQVLRGLNRGGVGVWRNYQTQLAPIMSILQPWIEDFGYAPR